MVNDGHVGILWCLMLFGVVLVVVRTSRLKLSTDILAALEWELGPPSSSN